MSESEWKRGEIQALLFPRAKYSRAEAKRWAADHGYATNRSELTGNYHRLIQRTSTDFNDFRTIELGRGIKAIYGRLKGNRKANPRMHAVARAPATTPQRAARRPLVAIQNDDGYSEPRRPNPGGNAIRFAEAIAETPLRGRAVLLAGVGRYPNAALAQLVSESVGDRGAVVTPRYAVDREYLPIDAALARNGGPGGLLREVEEAHDRVMVLDPSELPLPLLRKVVERARRYGVTLVASAQAPASDVVALFDDVFRPPSAADVAAAGLDERSASDALAGVVRRGTPGETRVSKEWKSLYYAPRSGPGPIERSAMKRTRNAGRDPLVELYDPDDDEVVWTGRLSALNRDNRRGDPTWEAIRASALPADVGGGAGVPMTVRAARSTPKSEHDDRWIQAAHLKRGRLHRYFGIPEDETIPVQKLRDELARLKKMRAARTPKRYTKSELSLFRAITLALRFKRQSNPVAATEGPGLTGREGCVVLPLRRDNGTFVDVTKEYDELRAGGGRVPNPVTLMNVANLVPAVASLMVGRTPNPPDVTLRPYADLPYRGLFVADVARTERGDPRLATKLDNGLARHVTGPHRGRNFRVASSANVLALDASLQRLPRKR